MRKAWALASFAVLSLANAPAWADNASASAALSGGVQDKEKMEPAVKLMIAPPPLPKPLPMQSNSILKSNVQQFSGSTEYSNGKLVPKMQNVAPSQFDSGTRWSFHPTLPKPFVPPPTPSYSQQNFRWNYTATPKNGIMTYAQGYGTQEIRQPQTRLQYSTNQPNRNLNTSLQFKQTGTGVHAYATNPPPPAQLKAAEYAMPVKHIPPPPDWAQWYKRVANAVYEQWKQSTVGPGRVTLELTVYNTNHLDVKVVDFSPAQGEEPNAVSDEKFREASLKTFHVLDGADVWTFPQPAQTTKKIAFDLELDHAVGETPGCSIIRMHNQ